LSLTKLARVLIYGIETIVVTASLRLRKLQNAIC